MLSFIDTKPQTQKNLAADEIIGLARKFNVTYRPLALDALADAMTRLSDDEVQLDDVQLTLIALYRAGVVSKAQSAHLSANYIREKYE